MKRTSPCPWLLHHWERPDEHSGFAMWAARRKAGMDHWDRRGRSRDNGFWKLEVAIWQRRLHQEAQGILYRLTRLVLDSQKGRQDVEVCMTWRSGTKLLG